MSGTIVTAPGDQVDFVSRLFAPKLSIPEDPVTGSSHCSLIPYWAERLSKKKLTALQLSARGGELFCEHVGGARQDRGQGRRLFDRRNRNLKEQTPHEDVANVRMCRRTSAGPACFRLSVERVERHPADSFTPREDSKNVAHWVKMSNDRLATIKGTKARNLLNLSTGPELGAWAGIPAIDRNTGVGPGRAHAGSFLPP